MFQCRCNQPGADAKAPHWRLPAEGNTSSSGAFPRMPAMDRSGDPNRGGTARPAMGETVDESVVESVLALHPWVRSRPVPERFGAALRALVESEGCRRGVPDPVSGALHVSALTQGALLRPEFDLSVH